MRIVPHDSLNLTRCNTLQQLTLLDLKEAREEDRKAKGLRRKHGRINGNHRSGESQRIGSLRIARSCFFFFFIFPVVTLCAAVPLCRRARSVQWNVRRHRTQQVELGCLSKKLPEFIKPRCGAVRLARSPFPTRPLETPFLCGNDRRHSDRRFLPPLPRSTRSRPSRKHKLSFLFVSLNRRGNFSGEIVDRAPSKWRKEDFLCWRGKKKEGKGGKRRIDDYEARTNRAGLPTDFSG